MELRNIEAFLKATETGSFSSAAERLFVSQSTISTRIKNLEKELNTQLFIRCNGNRVVLTKAGEKLYPSLKEGYELICRSIRQLTRPASRAKEFKISLPGHMAELLIEKLFDFINLTMAQYEISLRITRSQQVADSLLNEEIDLGFAYCDAPPDARRLGVMHIADLDTVLVCSPDHRILRIKPSFRLAELAKHRLIYYHTLTFQRFERFLRRSGLSLPFKALAIHKLELIKKLAMEQQDIALLQIAGVSQELKSGTLAKIPLEQPIPPTPLYLLYHPDVPEELLQAIAAWTRKTLQQFKD